MTKSEVETQLEKLRQVHDEYMEASSRCHELLTQNELVANEILFGILRLVNKNGGNNENSPADNGGNSDIPRCGALDTTRI